MSDPSVAAGGRWSVTFAAGPESIPDPAGIRILWTDEDDAYAVGRPVGAADWDYLVEVSGVAWTTIHVARRLAVVRALEPGIPDATLRHIWLDQIHPVLLDFDGSLVLHGGAVRRHGQGLVILGPSGRGKSTLVASLASPESPALNDDGVVIGDGDEGHTVAPTYPGLRLLPDSLARLVPAAVETSPVSHYASKRRIHRPGHLSAAPAPLGALVFLDPPRADGAIAVERIPPARACMGLVSQSFALDPTDRTRAASRLRQAAALAAAVPAFTLAYPRDYDRLPDVHAALFAAVDGTGARP